MKTYTGWQYLLIDLANAFGLDKLLFEERIEWAEKNLHQLESLVGQADKKSKPLYVKAIMAIRKAQAGQPTGHLVGFDAVCSGMQIMSVLTGCEAGADATGLINPNKRADAYTAVTKAMNEILGGVGVNVSRKEAKDATMTSLYGSKAQPKIIFGDGTPEIKAFYEAMNMVAPGAWALLQELLASWQPYALFHAWQLPDGFEAKIKVMDTIEARIEVDELDHSTFTYYYKENTGLPTGHHKAKSNAANVVHSVDAYVLRSVHRRCNYDLTMVEEAGRIIELELGNRAHLKAVEQPVNEGTKLAYYISLWQQSQMADVVILPYINPVNVEQIPHALLIKLDEIVTTMLAHKPFEVVTIHDEFKCHANNMNQLRFHYKEILADLAESDTLSYILSSIYGRPGKVGKMSDTLGQKIRQSNYALC